MVLLLLAALASRSRCAIHRFFSFNVAFHRNSWGSKESRSGKGSELQHTIEARAFLGSMIKEHQIASLLDSACGDCNWQPHIPGFGRKGEEPGGFEYTGVDIVSAAVASNQGRLGKAGQVSFHTLDLVEGLGSFLAQHHFDAILTRDALQHMRPIDALAVLRGFRSGSSRFLFANYYVTNSTAGNLASRRGGTGGITLIDLRQPPYNLPEPIAFTTEHPQYREGPEKRMGLWHMPQALEHVEEPSEDAGSQFSKDQLGDKLMCDIKFWWI